jgi:hypothetical protein
VSEYEEYDDVDGFEDADLVATPSAYLPGDIEQTLLQIRDTIANAKPLPLSTTVRVERDEVLDLLDEGLQQLPEELKAARWLLKEREEFLDKVRHEADEIVDQARDRAERMVQRTEVVKASEQRAYQILDNAEAEARRLRHEVEDFCDQKLASFEIVLERTMKLVSSGRAKLQGTALFEGPAIDDDEAPLPGAPPPPPPPLPERAPAEAEAGYADDGEDYHEDGYDDHGYGDDGTAHRADEE